LYESTLADFCHLLSLGHLSNYQVLEEDCPLKSGALTPQSRHQDTKSQSSNPFTLGEEYKSLSWPSSSFS